MFTGIVEEVGGIERLARRSSGLLARIACPGFGKGLGLGESVAVDGVCLTVVRRGADWFEAEISPETCRRTTFGGARAGRRVNLERPLSASARLGGHFVQGHVDATGAVASVRAAGDFVDMSFRFPAALAGLIVQKGSIAVNGVSLTVSGMARSTFSVALIPHTMKATTLSLLKQGDAVNLEVDILAKYVQALLKR